MSGFFSMLFMLVPEIVIMVFISVCVVQVARVGGPYGALAPLLLILVTDVAAICRVLKRERELRRTPAEKRD